MDVKHSFQLTTTSGAYDDDGRPKRTGNLNTVVAHIITAVIGSGVLSLAWSVAQLGWIGGPIALLCCAISSYVSSCLLADCYRSPDSITGKRNYSFMDAVRVNLGKKRTIAVGVLQIVSLYVNCTAYVITAATSIRAILRSNCYHEEGHDAPCKYGGNLYMMLFGLVQIVMSFIPDLHSMVWVSVVASIMSFAYSSIGLGLGVATVIKNGRLMGSMTGIQTANVADKIWLIFQAVGDISFSYPYSMIFLEIQDTLESTPPENKTMKKASMVSIFITTFFYLCCGGFGYAAFGNDTPGNLLTGFGFYEPFWLIDFANICIIIHLVGGYQATGQARAFDLFNRPDLGLAILFPYFNQVLGVLGGINFWPLAIYFPVEMYFVQKKIEAWSTQWIVLRIFSFACFLVTMMGFIGSFEGIIRAKLS
ncbi:hypothetical protein TSUD_127650 [Trifolium subterraneum]|nr:hypothetical protein TSUD_127650 [Trifolium subterraneum]